MPTIEVSRAFAWLRRQLKVILQLHDVARSHAFRYFNLTSVVRYMAIYGAAIFPLTAEGNMCHHIFLSQDREYPIAAIEHGETRISCYGDADCEEDRFNEVLICAVERGLAALGETVAQVILYNMEKKYSLKRRDILRNPDRFVEALQGIFGCGAETIQRLVVKSICSATGLDPARFSQLSFSSCVEEALKALKAEERRSR